MSATAEPEGLYSALDESARLLDVPCSREKVWPVLAAYAELLPQAVVAIRVATDARHAGELNCHVLSLPKTVDPYAVAVADGLVPKVDHPVGALLSDIGARCPIDSYGFDFGVVGGFQKTWSFFPADRLQTLSTLCDVPSMPRGLADNIGFFTGRGLDDRVSLVGVDYAQRTANVYFGEPPAACLEPAGILSMHRDLDLPEPSERMVRLGREAFGIYVTLRWDTPRIERISFSVLTRDPLALPIRLDPPIERFVRSFPYGAGGPTIVYAAMSSAGEEYYKIQSYYRWRPRVLDLMQLSEPTG